MAIYLSEEDVAALVTMDDALAVVERAHRAHALGKAVDLPRQRTRLPGVQLHILQGGLPGEGVLGCKVYTSTRAGARFLLHLYSTDDGRLLTVIAADRLGRLRTGAAAGIAAKYLAREDAAILALIGAGRQAEAQLDALTTVRCIKEVRLYCRDADQRRARAADFRRLSGASVRPMDSAQAAVEGANIVVTITTSSSPVLLGEWLTPGMHISAAGSNALARRELDETAVRRADLIVVDSRDVALREAGDLWPAIEKGHLPERQLVELGELVAGLRPGRTQEDQITLFESQGMAVQDLALAALVYRRACDAGRGVPLPF